eukprot:jgi/Botrbrau1/336/Bobra.0022s0290.1
MPKPLITWWLLLHVAVLGPGIVQATGPSGNKSRTCSNAACIRASLVDSVVEDIILRVSITLDPSWTDNGTVVLESTRGVTIRTDDPSMVPTLNLGLLPSLITMHPGSTLNFSRVALSNMGAPTPEALKLPLYSPNLALWPSVIVHPNATVVYDRSVVYWWNRQPDYNCTADVDGMEQELEGGWGHNAVNQINNNVIAIRGTHVYTTAIFQVSFSGGEVQRDNIGDALQVIVNATGICAELPAQFRVPHPSAAGHTAPFLWWYGAIVAVGLVLVVAFVVILYERRHPHLLRSCFKNHPALQQAGPGDDVELSWDAPSSTDPRGSNLGFSRSLRGSQASSVGDLFIRGTGGARGSGSYFAARSMRSAQPLMADLAALLWSRPGISKDNLELGPMVGKGSYGRVYKAKWNGVIVAVKVVEHNPEVGNNLDTLLESTLAQSINHPNLVHTYQILKVKGEGPPIKTHSFKSTLTEAGSLSDPTSKSTTTAKPEPLKSSHSEPATQVQNVPIEQNALPPDSAQSDNLEIVGSETTFTLPQMEETWMVLEWCGRGTLHHAMKSGWLASKDTGKPNMRVVLACLKDVAFGMSYLHSLGVLHGDLKPANVLLKSAGDDFRRYICKLGDFGLSRVLGDQASHISTHTYGTISFMPPELVRDARLSKASDVYSFGIMMWELFCGENAFDGIPHARVFYMIAVDDERPLVPEGMPLEYRTLMEECWCTHPEQRPPFAAVLTRIARMLEESCVAASSSQTGLGGSSKKGRRSVAGSREGSGNLDGSHADATLRAGKASEALVKLSTTIARRVSGNSSGDLQVSPSKALRPKGMSLRKPSLNGLQHTALNALRWNRGGASGSPSASENLEEQVQRVAGPNPASSGIPQSASCPGLARDKSSDSEGALAGVDALAICAHGAEPHREARRAGAMPPKPPLKGNRSHSSERDAQVAGGRGPAQVQAVGPSPLVPQPSAGPSDTRPVPGVSLEEPSVPFVMKSPFQTVQGIDKPASRPGGDTHAAKPTGTIAKSPFQTVQLQEPGASVIRGGGENDFGGALPVMRSPFSQAADPEVTAPWLSEVQRGPEGGRGPLAAVPPPAGLSSPFQRVQEPLDRTPRGLPEGSLGSRPEDRWNSLTQQPQPAMYSPFQQVQRPWPE